MTRLSLDTKELYSEENEELRSNIVFFRYMPVVWQLYERFFHDIMTAKNTTEPQKKAALELLNLCEFCKLDKFGTPEKVGPAVPSAGTTNAGGGVVGGMGPQPAI